MFLKISRIRMSEENEKKGLKKAKRKIDTILLGVVVGGAVGSILGSALRSKKGVEARMKMDQKRREVWEKISQIIDEKQEGEKNSKTGFWHLLHHIFRKKNKNE